MSAPAPVLKGSVGREAAEGFIRRVGQNVRARREAAGVSRRALAEQSGLSQRYLAELEAGRGNISIALLYRVAMALGVEVAELVAARPRAAGLAGRIALIGLRGAGKTTLGKRAAQRLALDFVELSELVEEANGMPAGEAISLYGEAGYRASQRAALERIIAERDQVLVAVGGGIVSDGASFDLLLENFRTIWLSARPEEHMERVRAQGDLRPMAGISDAMARLRRILRQREAQYGRADARVDTSAKSEAASLEELIAVLRSPPAGAQK